MPSFERLELVPVPFSMLLLLFDDVLLVVFDVDLPRFVFELLRVTSGVAMTPVLTSKFALLPNLGS